MLHAPLYPPFLDTLAGMLYPLLCAIFGQSSRPERHPAPVDSSPKKRFEDSSAYDGLAHDIPHGVRLHAAVPDS